MAVNFTSLQVKVGYCVSVFCTIRRYHQKYLKFTQ